MASILNLRVGGKSQNYILLQKKLRDTEKRETDMNMEEYKQDEDLQNKLQEDKCKEDVDEMPLSVLSAPSSRCFYERSKSTEKKKINARKM
ncbi:hypothetical protein QE152_g7802 [Popillia japonica]|uniref:Uncharacterized protein n=1 Tax=Popillia japonica TaxID=7064 RepID=A0AAW1MF88_POPJA